MHINHFAFISPFLLLSCASLSPAIDPPDQIKFVLTCDDIGPFTQQDTDEITIHFSYKYKGTTGYKKVYEMLTGQYNGAVVSRYYTDYHTLRIGQTVDFDLNLALNTFSKNKFMDITFQIISDAATTVLYTKKTVLERCDPLIINPTSDGVNDYYGSYSVINIGAGLRKRETYDFSDNSVVFFNDNYYELSLEGQRITYDYFKDFTYSNAYLTFYDKENNFRYFPRIASKIQLPLDIVQEGNILTFKFKNTYFVDPHTLAMSPLRRTGFVRTSRFYLPIGKRETFENKKFTIDITNAGCSGSTITMDVSYYSTRNLFGYCQNSDYCITGGNV